MRLFFLPFVPRYITLTCVIALFCVTLWCLYKFPDYLTLLSIPLVLFGGLTLLGLRDLLQRRHSILRSYPLAAQLRYLFERIRPEMRQYFFEGDKDGVPFSRDKRAVVYQRAKGQLDKRPFGTQYDVYAPDFEWFNHSAVPKKITDKAFRIEVGGPDCKQTYSASVFNISAMSFGAISPNAIRALNIGAKKGDFAHTTGEGGISKYHQKYGGDLIWQIGSGYFGCRNKFGEFCEETFAEVAGLDAVKMIELKLSQGAKPGHGGVLPKEKISREIARTRKITRDKDCISPAAHSMFSTPIQLMHFIKKMRDLSGGKPVGFKLCIGHSWEFLAICKGMLATGITPDFIVVDGKEGGTGASPLEFADHMGMPLRDGLSFVHNSLVGVDLRDKIKIGASGKIVSAFDMARVMALGADYCNAGRGFMFALGCIQAQQCHTDHCPTGIATQDWTRQRALVVSDKATRVYNFHQATVEALAELVSAIGLSHPSELQPHHLSKRISGERVATFDKLFPHLTNGALLVGSDIPQFSEAWNMASAESFTAVNNKESSI